MDFRMEFSEESVGRSVGTRASDAVAERHSVCRGERRQTSRIHGCLTTRRSGNCRMRLDRWGGGSAHLLALTLQENFITKEGQ